MNEVTRKGVNALVATVDCFTAVLAAEVQAGEEKQRQLDALVGQLKSCSNREQDLQVMLEDSDKELAAEKTKVESLSRERDDLLLKCKNLQLARIEWLSTDEARKVLSVLKRVKALVALSNHPRAKSFGQALVLLAREMKTLDDLQLDP